MCPWLRPPAACLGPHAARKQLLDNGNNVEEQDPRLAWVVWPGETEGGQESEVTRSGVTLHWIPVYLEGMEGGLTRMCTFLNVLYILPSKCSLFCYCGQDVSPPLHLQQKYVKVGLVYC